MITLEAAVHEAGHAVVAYHSKFYRISDINLGNSGTGVAAISLSRRKLEAAGKAPDQSSERDPEVAADMAIILAAGLGAEMLGDARIDKFYAEPDRATPDITMMQEHLLGAGLSGDFEKYQDQAEVILDEKWELVITVAKFLLQKVSTTKEEMEDFISSWVAVAH